MASLQASCTILSSNTRSHSSSTQPLSAKPSYLFTRPRRSHHFQVSCDAKKNVETSQGKIDRRNMLLGLGGMYGAANILGNPSAYADPVQAPDFTKCGDAHDVQSGDALDAKCCPPPADKIIDYKLPPVKIMRTRPAAHRASSEQVAKYEEAIRRMRELDKTDPQDPRGFTQQANIHCAYCNGAHDQVGYNNLDLQVHNSWLFFPFHRWYLYFYERILGNLIGDPTFVLPFWNWDNPKGMTLPPIFDNSNSPLYDEKRDPNNRGSAIVDLTFSGSTDSLQLVANNLTSIYSEMVRSVSTTNDFMGKPYCAGTNPSPGGGSSENGSHTGIHWWVGTKDRTGPNKYNEDMGNFYSAGRDPVFYCHHSNVDRMWTIWRDVLETDVLKDITSADYLNAEFLFYDENKRLVRVKAGDCLDQRRLGYDYDRIDLPWLNYRPPKKATKAKVSNISDAKTAASVLPVNLKETVRVIVPKSAKGKVDEQLMLENIETDSTKFIKFDVFINDEDDKIEELDRAEYAGSFAQVPHKSKNKKGTANISLRLTSLYEEIDVSEDDTVVVTIVPRSNGEDVTIGGIKIVPVPARSS
ncbi:polyphenol oxidase I, chloroplastic-like [Olea europaea subsp. europaea]|uniref:Polyphenol oxidase I, chloroplastic-like n=1 Tax=Olea europaea subsp. europaea TaxID=158383 RepID=A0A8S0RZ97_OLEEU|nr:polyphenol oxidase I, chloroplastic-like [Olea europaea subsp. europaea]